MPIEQVSLEVGEHHDGEHADEKCQLDRHGRFESEVLRGAWAKHEQVKPSPEERKPD